jgi:T4 RnlA family RNA ligase
MNLIDFPNITHMDQIRGKVLDKPEIKWNTYACGITVGCYVFQDKTTFDSAEARECRGIAFDSKGRVVSRPLHKFGNLGEFYSLDDLKALAWMGCIAGVYEKLDGSIISTSAHPTLPWAIRSRKSYSSDVVKIAVAYLKGLTTGSDEWGLVPFIKLVIDQDFTACFELTSPEAQIVLPQDRTQLRLLHVRDNFSGEYVMLDPGHPVHDWIDTFDIPLCPKLTGPIDEYGVDAMLEAIRTEEAHEGVVIQLTNGDMIKVKTPWYLRLHKSISFMRERDIAELALRGELDDVRANLAEVGIPTAEVDSIESRVKGHLLEITDAFETVMKADSGLSRKEFAIRYNGHIYFGLMMAAYLGKEVDVAEFYRRHCLDNDFSLRTLVPGAAETA